MGKIKMNISDDGITFTKGKGKFTIPAETEVVPVKKQRKPAPPITDETRLLMRKAAKKRWNSYSPDQRRKMVCAMNGFRREDD